MLNFCLENIKYFKENVSFMSGTLYLCATPIGNLEDMTYRAVRMLAEADLIAAEDTRNSQKLLNHYDIHTKLTSYHEHNKWDKGRTLISKLLEGEDIVLITDAGMPGISDPGAELVKMAADEGIKVSVLPGATASLSALTISALPTRYFAFEGFLPTDTKDRKKRIEILKDEERTFIIYEAPHRLKKTLEELACEFGGARKAAVVRELTKKHETVVRGTLSELSDHYKTEEPKGECVIVIEGKDPDENARKAIEQWDELSVKEHYELYITGGMDRKEAMKQVAKDRGLSKRDIYSLLVNDR